MSAQRSGASQPQSFGTQHGRRRSVHGVRLFTTPPGQQSRGAAAQVTAVPDCLSVEDITGVGSQVPTSTFSPVVQASPIHNAPPAAESQPSTRRHHISCRTGKWTNTQLQNAMAAVDGGMSMKKASHLYHIPYTSFREWCYGLRSSRKKGPPAVLSQSEEKQLVDYCIRACVRWDKV